MPIVTGYMRRVYERALVPSELAAIAAPKDGRQQLSIIGFEAGDWNHAFLRDGRLAEFLGHQIEGFGREMRLSGVIRAYLSMGNVDQASDTLTTYHSSVAFAYLIPGTLVITPHVIAFQKEELGYSWNHGELIRCDVAKTPEGIEIGATTLSMQGLTCTVKVEVGEGVPSSIRESTIRNSLRHGVDENSNTFSYVRDIFIDAKRRN